MLNRRRMKINKQGTVNFLLQKSSQSPIYCLQIASTFRNLFLEKKGIFK